MDLDVDLWDIDSIDRAIAQVEDVKVTLSDNMINAKLHAFVERCVEIIKDNIDAMGIVDTGNLRDSVIGFYNPKLGAGVIEVRSRYGIFVEYGTGVNNIGTFTMGTPHDGYETGGTGKSQWAFPNREGVWRMTSGQASRPFFHVSLEQIETEFNQLVEEISNGI